MTNAEYCIESNAPIVNRLLPMFDVPQRFLDPSHAVAVAVKCFPNPYGAQVRVVHIPTGEVIFSAGPSSGSRWSGEVERRVAA